MDGATGQAAKMSDKDLDAALLSEINKEAARRDGIEQPPQQAEQTPQASPEPSGKVEQNQAKPEGQATVEPKKEEPKVEPKVEPKPDLNALQELMQKKGMKDVGQFTKSYTELEREHTRKSQELARLQRQAATPQLPQYPAPIPQAESMEMARQAFYDNPIAATELVARQALLQQFDDLNAKVNETRLHDAVVELSSSPRTMYFNMPEVQEEIKKVLGDEGWVNDIPGNLRKAYKIAVENLREDGRFDQFVGNLYEKGKEAGASEQLQKQGSVMEGAATPAGAEKPFNKLTATDEELAARVRELAGQLDRQMA